MGAVGPRGEDGEMVRELKVLVAHTIDRHLR